MGIMVDYSEIANNRGYAVISFNPIDIAADNSSFRGAFYILYLY